MIRVAVGAGVFGFLVLRHPAELGHTLARAQGWWVAGAGVVFLAGVLVSALRWRAYLDALELHLPMSTLVRLYFVGSFFNAFLPTGIGGDAYKAVRIGRSRGRGVAAFASVFLDRFAGVVALSVIGFAGILSELIAGDPDLRVALLSLVLSGAILGAAVLLLWRGERLLGRGRIVKRQGIGGQIRNAMRAIHAAGRHREAAARGAFYGLVFQSLVLTYHLLLARSLPGLRGVSIGSMAGIVVISSLATMIPITVNGLGFREGAYVWALGVFGVSQANARAFAVLVLATMLTTSLAGGVVYVIAGGDVPEEPGETRAPEAEPL